VVAPRLKVAAGPRLAGVSQRSDASRGSGDRDKRRVSGAVGQRFMRVRVLRRWYIRRTLRFIDRSKAKGRRLPEGMAEAARLVARVPKAQRAQAFEDAILASHDTPNLGRQFRRAAAHQHRSGKSDARHRPGPPPGAVKQARRGSP
jgi:hypothetical protein